VFAFNIAKVYFKMQLIFLHSDYHIFLRYIWCGVYSGSICERIYLSSRETLWKLF